MKSYKNISYVLERKSFPLFLSALNNFVDTKEWSEVGGVYNLCRKLMVNFNPDIIFDVGCGKRPTLALLMALNYKAVVHAIDPQLDNTYCAEIERLNLHSVKLEEFAKSMDIKRETTALILANHSHVSSRYIRAFLSKFKIWVYVTVPCCVSNRLSDEVGVCFKDIHMHTDKNDVYVYSNKKEYLSNMFTKG